MAFSQTTTLLPSLSLEGNYSTPHKMAYIQ